MRTLRPRKVRIAIRTLLVASMALLLAWWLLPAPPIVEPLTVSTQVLDRDGRLVHLSLTPDEKYRVPVPLDQVSQALIDATLLQEDRYYWRHNGVNPIALVRAFSHVLMRQSGHGGASTITMQVARMRYRLHTKTASGKGLQIYRALQLERHFSKAQLLETYLNSAPYGGNIEGVGAASMIHFGKPPSRLTASEATLLAVLPQSPTRRAPHGGVANRALLAAVDRLDARRDGGGMFTGVTLRRGLPTFAPHFTRCILKERTAGGSQIASTLDPRLQELVDSRISAFLASRRTQGLDNAAALLIDTRSMEVLAQAGSADFGNDAIAGQVDATRSRRSPGSTLKPFIYALAMDQGLIHPRTMLTDAPRRFGAYAPENFDGEFAGPIPADDALARSRNVPAVALAERLHKPGLYQFLLHGGVALPREESFYGLSLPLGGGEVTMEELVRLYAMLANGGKLQTLRRLVQHEAAPTAPRLLSAEACALTLQMLGNVPRPGIGSAAGDEGIAWKTGTSMGFRDAWSVAVFDHLVLAVWVGNNDGRRNPALVGRTCAGPLLFQIIDAIRASHTRPIHRELEPPPGLNLKRLELCALSGGMLTPSCAHKVTGWFIPGISPIAPCEVHREILVDNETGLRLPDGEELDGAHKAIYEFWPSDLQKLFEAAGLPRRVPPPFAPGAEVESIARSGKSPEIVSPTPGRTYALKAEDAANSGIPLQARSEGDSARIYWFAGKTFLGSCAPRESLPWKPTPGEYRLTALDDHGRTGTATVTLQALAGQ